MRRTALRLVEVASGVALLGFYLGVAYVGFRLFLVLWAGRPDPVTTLVVLVVVALVGGYLSYRAGSVQVLRGLGAVELPPSRAPGLYRRLDRLAAEMRVGSPTLAVASVGSPNALSLGGPRDGVVVLDEGLLRLLDGDEIEAILAHELAHVEGRDGLVQVLGYSVLRTLVGLVVLAVSPVLVVLFGVTRALALLAGTAAAGPESPVARVRRSAELVVPVLLVGLTLLVRAHSRRREFAADDRAVEVTGDPLALARALRKIQRATEPGRGLLSPLSVRGDDEALFGRLLSTHPPTDDRVRRLVERAETASVDGVRRIPIE